MTSAVQRTSVSDDAPSGAASCSCLKAIKARLKEHHRTDVDLELKRMIKIDTLSIMSSLPPLQYSYMDGKKRKKSYVTFNYCPFCGKPI